MVENLIRQTSKKTWYKWSLYINIILFFIVAIFIYMVVNDAYNAGIEYGQTFCEDGAGDSSGWLFALARDVAILAVAIALIFFQFFRNLMLIMKRSL